MPFWTWKWKCNLNSLDWYIPTKCDYISTKIKTKWEKKKVKITHKQLKVECIQLTKFMANIQKKWNHYKANVKWTMTKILMSGLTSDQTFD